MPRDALESYFQFTFQKTKLYRVCGVRSYCSKWTASTTSCESTDCKDGCKFNYILESYSDTKSVTSTIANKMINNKQNFKQRNVHLIDDMYTFILIVDRCLQLSMLATVSKARCVLLSRFGTVRNCHTVTKFASPVPKFASVQPQTQL